MKFLRFDSEVVARVAFSDFMQKGDWPVYIGLIAVDVVGTVYKPTGVMLEDDIPEMEALPGFHINLSDSVHELAQYEIDAPATPSRVFAGAGDQAAPRVPAEVARWQAKLALMHQVDGQGVSLWDRLLQLRESLTDAVQQTMLDAAMNEVMNWKRYSPTVLWAAEQLGLTPQQVDERFIYAHALEL